MFLVSLVHFYLRFYGFKMFSKCLCYTFNSTRTTENDTFLRFPNTNYGLKRVGLWISTQNNDFQDISDTVTQKQKPWQPLLFVEIHTHYRPPFCIGMLQIYFKSSIFSIFYLQMRCHATGDISSS